MSTAHQTSPSRSSMTINGASMPIFNIHFATMHDQATGQASGKRQHKPIVVTKEWGANSPTLFGLMHSNAALPEVCIEAGGSKQWVSLVNAQIVNIRKASVGGKLRERITFTYEGIELGKGAAGQPVDTHEQERVAYTFQRIDIENRSGKTATDDWLTP